MFFAFWLSFSAAGSVQAAQATPRVPFEVRTVRLDSSTTPPAYGLILVTVQNTTDRLILAWGVTVETLGPDGQRQTTSFVVDSAVAPIDKRRSAIPPSGSATRQFAIKIPVGAAISVTPTMAVFDDDSAIGTDRAIQGAFAIRAVCQRFWHFVQASIDEIASQRVSAGVSLQLIDARLRDTSDAELRDTALAHAIRERLTPEAQARVGQSPSVILQRLSDEVRTRVLDIDTHAVRRQ